MKNTTKYFLISVVVLNVGNMTGAGGIWGALTSNPHLRDSAQGIIPACVGRAVGYAYMKLRPNASEDTAIAIGAVISQGSTLFFTGSQSWSSMAAAQLGAILTYAMTFAVVSPAQNKAKVEEALHKQIRLEEREKIREELDKEHQTKVATARREGRKEGFEEGQRLVEARVRAGGGNPQPRFIGG